MTIDFQQLEDDEGWITIQRRLDNSVDFYIYWDDYLRGFGTDDGNLWLGLERIYCLTSQGPTELKVTLEAFNGDVAYAAYDLFSISDSESNYILTLGEYSGMHIM